MSGDAASSQHWLRRIWDALSGTLSVSLQSAALVKGTLAASSSGDTTVYTPTSGKKIRLYFFGYSGGANVTGVTINLKLEGYNGGASFDAQYFSADGQPYARNIQAGAKYIEGSVDGRLIVNLSAAQTIHVNYELEEIDP